MHELVELIVDKYDGSLKAEHGTGINMAPFVEREWGAKATELMWRVKQLADPDGILAPGVVLNRDPGVHLQQPEVHARDRGGRDQVRRVRLLRAGVPVAQRDARPHASGSCCAARWRASRRARRCCDALPEQFEYDGAADVRRRRLAAALACPVGIDTGELVKQLRAAEHRPRAERAALRGRPPLERRSKRVRARPRCGRGAGARRGAPRALTGPGGGCWATS